MKIRWCDSLAPKSPSTPIILKVQALNTGCRALVMCSICYLPGFTLPCSRSSHHILPPFRINLLSWFLPWILCTCSSGHQEHSLAMSDYSFRSLLKYHLLTEAMMAH